MATSLTVGKARLCNLTLHNPDGTVNTTATKSFSSGNTSTMRATINPSDPSQGAVVGVATTNGVNATLSAPVGPAGAPRQVQSLFQVNAAPVDLSNAEITFGDEVDPPSWA